MSTRHSSGGAATNPHPVRRFVTVPFQARTWTATGFLLLNGFTGNFWFGIITNGLAMGLALAVVGVGVLILLVMPLLVRAGGQVERELAQAILRVDIPDPYRALPEGPLLRRGRALIADPATWKDLAYLLLLFPLGLIWGAVTLVGWGTALALVCAPLYYWALPADSAFTNSVATLPWALLATAVGLCLVVLTANLVRAMASVQGHIARGLLGPSQAQLLAHQAEELRASRARTVDAAAAERRRIERDLHDGAQQRLVSLAMDLGRAREKFDTEPGAAQALVGEAHVEAKRALHELRDLARGIHPAVLSDQGLDAAISALAGRCPVPVDINVELTERPPPAVETIAYFVVVEALTNVAKYARARQASVNISRVEDSILTEIRDDGGGGDARWRAGGAGRPGRRCGRFSGGLQPDRGPDDRVGGAAVRVVIAEDSVLLREGLGRLLADGGHETVAVVGDGPNLIAAVDEHRPDLAVVDIRMPPTHTDEGLRAALELRRRTPATAILVLSQYVEERYAVDLIGGGADGVGYLLKDRVADVGDFLDAVGRVGTGGTAIDPEVVAQLLSRRGRGKPLDTLTSRELEVLGLIAEGRSNGGIAAELFVTEGAVEKHVSSIFGKLGLAGAANHPRVLAVLTYLRH